MHTVEAEGASLFEVAAAAVRVFRSEGWTDALTPNAVLHIHVQLPPVVHDVPLRAVERWLNAPSVSPGESLAKKEFQPRRR